MMTHQNPSRRKPLLMTKPCRVCGIEKSLIEFYKDARSRNGRRNDCKLCKNIYKKTHEAKLRRMGKCGDCGEWNISGKASCAKHLEHDRAARLQQIEDRKQEDKCISCGIRLHEDMDMGRLTCLNCLERVRT